MYIFLCVNILHNGIVQIRILKHFFKRQSFKFWFIYFFTSVVTFTWTTLRQLQVNQLEATEFAVDPDLERPVAVWQTSAGGQRLSVTCFSLECSVLPLIGSCVTERLFISLLLHVVQLSLELLRMILIPFF